MRRRLPRMATFKPGGGREAAPLGSAACGSVTEERPRLLPSGLLASLHLPQPFPAADPVQRGHERMPLVMRHG